jgi:hypothetical protein
MRAERALFGSWLATALGVAGVLVPKCPLCVAAYLCLFGVSAGSAQALVKLGAPLCLGLIVASALGTALFVAERGRRLAKRGASCAKCSLCQPHDRAQGVHVGSHPIDAPGVDRDTGRVTGGA